VLPSLLRLLDDEHRPTVAAGLGVDDAEIGAIASPVDHAPVRPIGPGESHRAEIAAVCGDDLESVHPFPSLGQLGGRTTWGEPTPIGGLGPSGWGYAWRGSRERLLHHHPEARREPVSGDAPACRGAARLSGREGGPLLRPAEFCIDNIASLKTLRAAAQLR